MNLSSKLFPSGTLIASAASSTPGTARWTGRCRDVGKTLQQRIESCGTIIYCCRLCVRQRNFLPHTQQTVLAFEKCRGRRAFGRVERALRARHAVRALIEKIVRAVAVAFVPRAA